MRQLTQQQYHEAARVLPPPALKPAALGRLTIADPGRVIDGLECDSIEAILADAGRDR